MKLFDLSVTRLDLNVRRAHAVPVADHDVVVREVLGQKRIRNAALR